MRVALVFCAVMAVAVAAAVPDSFASQKMAPEGPHTPAANIETATFFTQRDHTRPQEREPVLFQYHANLDHYREGGAFYIYMKDVIDHSTRWIEEGLVVDVAAETGAALFTFERRYYGPNRPTPTASFADLEFLTVEQSVADVAVFITEIRRAHGVTNNRIVLWGSRHGATIAAWARKRYPHLVDAVWSSSGVFEIETFTFSQYDLLQYTILSTGGAQCRDLVYSAFQTIDYLLQAGNGEYLQQRLNLCFPVDTVSETDSAALIETTIQQLLSYVETFHSQGVQNFCNDMNFYQGDALNSFARWKSYVYGHDFTCFDHRYETIVGGNSVTEFDQPQTDIGRRQTYYLQCTQLGLFSIMDDLTWLPNRLDITYHLQKCNDIFGPEYAAILLTPANIALRTEFGSLDQRITNIIYTNGAIDTWLYNGMLITRDYNATVFNIEYHSKSADLSSITTADPPGLDYVKRIIREQIILFS